MTLEKFTMSKTAKMEEFAKIWSKNNKNPKEMSLFDWVDAYEAFAK